MGVGPPGGLGWCGLVRFLSSGLFSFRPCFIIGIDFLLYLFNIDFPFDILPGCVQELFRGPQAIDLLQANRDLPCFTFLCLLWFSLANIFVEIRFPSAFFCHSAAHLIYKMRMTFFAFTSGVTELGTVKTLGCFERF